MQTWVALAFFGAFSQALGMAVKKYALQTPNLNNCIGFFSYAIASGVLWIWYNFDTHGHVHVTELTIRFWEAIVCFSGGNLIAMWCMYKALDSAEFSYLMPFMSVTSLSIIIPPMLFLGEIPSKISLIGIIFIVIGAYYMNYKKHQPGEMSIKEQQQRTSNKKAMIYFMVIALLYTFTPTVAKIAIRESSVSFTTFLSHAFMGVGFFVLMMVNNEVSKLIVLVRDRKFFLWIVSVFAAGCLSALENGSINIALQEASVAYVFAIKRTMPLFAFCIGYVYFRERSDLSRKLLATICMVMGSIVTILA